MRLTTSGAWPGLIVCKQGWARAEARPWNDDLPDASVRLVRGGASFLRHVASFLLSDHAQAALSSPLPERGTRTWRQAGFRDHLLLDMYRHDLLRPVPDPESWVRALSDPPWAEAIALDREAFETRWRLSELGLKEAYGAISRSAFLAVSDGPRLSGYAVVGTAGSYGYLQRIAVHPSRQRMGLGRALVRACLRFVRAHGGSLVFLNTQPDNRGAASLYISEGFVRDPKPLHILRVVPEAIL